MIIVIEGINSRLKISVTMYISVPLVVFHSLCVTGSVVIFIDVLGVDRSVEDVFFFVGGRNLGDCMHRNMAG